MKTKLFLIGLLSFLYVSSQVGKLLELPVLGEKTTAVHHPINQDNTSANPDFAPANDECDTATELTVNQDYNCGTVTSGTLFEATDSGIEADLGQADDDVWFSFTATSSTHNIEVSNIVASTWQGEDLAVELFEADCSGTLVESSDPETFIVSNLVPETVYYVRVYSYYDYIVDTTFDICIGTPPPPPANDECSGAIALPVGLGVFCATSTAGTLQSATDSGVEWVEGDADDDVWYSFVASSTSHLIFLEDIEGNDTDMAFEVLGGICGEQNSVQGFYANNGIVTELEIGTTYYLRVYTYYDNPNPDTTFTICISTPAPPPANDECDAAVELTVNADFNCEAITSGTINFATNSGIDAETGNPDDDVWYRFTALSETQKISVFNILGTTTDFVIEVFDGECGGEIVVSSDPQTVVVEDLSVGSEYYLRVFTYNSEFHFASFDICIGTLPDFQANDECEGAIPLTVNTNGLCDVVTTASLAAATDSGIETEEGSPDDDVWFSFVATGTSHKVVITETDDFATLLIEVFDGTCGQLNLISDPESIFVNDLEIGTTYYVRVFSYQEEPTNISFEICLTERQAAPINDECEGAVALTVDAGYCNGVLNNGTNLGSTGSDWEASLCMDNPQNDVWFSFTVPANVASVNISTDFTGASITDTVLALYSGACGDLIEMDCNDDNGNSSMSIIEDVEVNVGETYYVRMAGYSQLEEGNFCLEITTNENLSTDNFEKNSLKAYPNPVKNFLNLSHASAINDVAIFNLLGQEVFRRIVNANTAQLDLSNLATGAYLVKITSDTAIQTIKIIKE